MATPLVNFSCRRLSCCSEVVLPNSSLRRKLSRSSTMSHPLTVSTPLYATAMYVPRYTQLRRRPRQLVLSFIIVFANLGLVAGFVYPAAFSSLGSSPALSRPHTFRQAIETPVPSPSSSSSTSPSITPILRDTFDCTGFFCPFRTFGVEALVPSSSFSSSSFSSSPPSSAAKPLLLYLPGLDGSGLTAFVQYPALAAEFEVRCLTMPNTDRSTFMDLVHLVRTELRSFPHRQVFLMGESFGGLLALGTALERINRPDARESTTEIKGVVLVNPATSYSRTIWAKFGQAITKLPEPFYGLSLLPIGLLLVDAGQIQSVIKDAFGRLREISSVSSLSSPRPSPPNPADQRARMAALGLSPFQIEFFSAALPVLIERLNLLPAPCLEWRLLQWLGAGSEMVEPQLHRIKTPVLVVAGTVDRLLPSFEEAKRLKRELTDCQIHFVEGAGHGGSLDQRVQLLEILKGWAPVGRVLG